MNDKPVVSKNLEDAMADLEGGNNESKYEQPILDYAMKHDTLILSPANLAKLKMEGHNSEKKLDKIRTKWRKLRVKREVEDEEKQRIQVEETTEMSPRSKAILQIQGGKKALRKRKREEKERKKLEACKIQLEPSFEEKNLDLVPEPDPGQKFKMTWLKIKRQDQSEKLSIEARKEFKRIQNEDFRAKKLAEREEIARQMAMMSTGTEKELKGMEKYKHQVDIAKKQIIWAGKYVVSQLYINYIILVSQNETTMRWNNKMERHFAKKRAKKRKKEQKEKLDEMQREHEEEVVRQEKEAARAQRRAELEAQGLDLEVVEAEEAAAERKKNRLGARIKRDGLGKTLKTELSPKKMKQNVIGVAAATVAIGAVGIAAMSPGKRVAQAQAAFSPESREKMKASFSKEGIKAQFSPEKMKERKDKLKSSFTPEKMKSSLRAFPASPKKMAMSLKGAFSRSNSQIHAEGEEGASLEACDPLTTSDPIQDFEEAEDLELSPQSVPTLDPIEHDDMLEKTQLNKTAPLPPISPSS